MHKKTADIIGLILITIFAFFLLFSCNNGSRMYEEFFEEKNNDTEEIYTATFHLNGGIGFTDGIQITQKLGEPWALPPTMPSWIDATKKFIGWNTDGTVETFLNTSSWAFTEDKDIYAIYSANPVLDWFFSGGTPSGDYTPSGAYAPGTAITAPATVTKTGYTFTGWSPAFTGTMSDTDVTYVAQFNPITYTVHFIGNGATGGSVADEVFTYDVPFHLNTNEYTRTNYIRKGWNTVAKGTGTAYTEEEIVQNLASTQGAVVNLYAQWEITPLSGKFSVSSSKQVSFARGNLYYNTSEGIFGIEEHQYDFTIVPDTGIWKQIWVPDHVCNFYWSKTENVTYALSYSDTGAHATNDIFFTNATATTPNSSFTVAGATGKYRTLSGGMTGEWAWLLGPYGYSCPTPVPGTNCRTSSTVNGVYNARFVKVRIDLGSTKYVNGLVIFPDVYTHPAGVTLPSSINEVGAAYATNTYDVSDWNEMEAAGAVFLPALSMRTNNQIQWDYNNEGFYFTSSPQGNVNNAMRMFFSNSTMCSSDFGMRGNAYTIRLVTDTN